jgi:hypothetical protein
VGSTTLHVQSYDTEAGFRGVDLWRGRECDSYRLSEVHQWLELEHVTW